MIKNLSELQRSAKNAYFARRLTKALRANNIMPSPAALVSAFNKDHKDNPLKPHTVRKWLIGDAKPRQESLVLLATWLKVSPEELVGEEDSVKVGIEIDFTDQEVISKYLSMNVKQKAAVSLLVDTILENAR
jgi:transcriptional regulator with XRE-family HTH domain